MAQPFQTFSKVFILMQLSEIWTFKITAIFACIFLSWVMRESVQTESSTVRNLSKHGASHLKFLDITKLSAYFWALCSVIQYFIIFAFLKKNSRNFSNFQKGFLTLQAPTHEMVKLKQFASCCPQIAWVCLTILWGWHLKG